MKTTTTLRALGLLGFIGLAPLAAADAGTDLAIDQVPKPVQQTITREALGQDVRWVQKDTFENRTVYTVRIKQDGLDRRLVVGEDGSLIGSPEWGGTSSGGMAGNDSMQIADLPAAVRATFEREAAGSEIRSIERDLADGKAVYHARIQQDGLDKRVSVDEHGALVRKLDWDGSPASDADATATTDRADDLEGDIALDQAPLPVQATIKREAGAQPIAEIERDRDDGALVYKARIEQEGIDTRLTVAADGTVLDKSDWTEENAKAGQAWETTKQKSGEAWEATKEGSAKAWDKTKTGTDKAWDKTQDFFDGDDLDVGSLPAPVRTTVEREAAGREVRDVDHELEGGKHFYEVKVHVEDGEDLHLRVGEDGALIEKKH
ncbi:MAG TPA: PepSY-like domain-containing protein [Planctomycetota bacterium]|nr:PepSY-like domain-containing protein [Planctomycetota bacterium]